MEKEYIYINQNLLDLKRKNKYCKYPDGFKNIACEYYINNGISLIDVARKFGVNRLTLKDWLESRGVFENDFTRLRKFDHENILKDIENNMKGIDIAKKYGCSESLVSAIRNGRL